MTDGVARELEQAEARLVEAREEAWDASRRLLDAAIEVGRLRALAAPVASDGTPANRCHGCWTAGRPALMPRAEMYRCFYCDRYWCRSCGAEHFNVDHAALAAREEVQG